VSTSSSEQSGVCVKPCNIVILISGSGSNLQAIIDAVCDKQINARICAVISNKADAYGLERARKAGIACELVDHKQYDCREDFDQALAARIEAYQPNLVILAGFMRILTDKFVRQFKGRLLNIHPSLLPKYPGLHTHQRALDSGDSEHGATVHFVTEELDGGPAIIQARVPIMAGDDATILAERVLTKEHVIYPLAAQWFTQGRLELKDDKVLLDKQVLCKQGFQYRD
jgi:phosphoribosylglycinamide formyltransferase-1